MTSVINVRNMPARLAAVVAGTYVYCGRPSPWGNPHPVNRPCRVCTFRLGTGKLVTHKRGEAIEEFRKDFLANPRWQEAARDHLTDKVLGCFCWPQPCHCDVYADFLNARHTPTPSQQ